MKKKIFKSTILVFLFLSMVAYSNTSKAAKIPQNYLTFIWTSATSGYLWCGGEGICAEYFGSTIYFGTYVGHWDGYYETNANGDSGYLIDQVVGN